MTITPNGLVIKTFSEIEDELGTEERAYIDPDLDTSTNTVAGQFNAITARQLALLWQSLQIVFNQMNPDQAEGVLLDNLCKLTGIIRSPATYSTALLDCTFKYGGVLLESDNAFVTSSVNSTIKFTPVANYTSPFNDDDGNPYTYPPTGLTFPVLFRCSVTGPTEVNADTLSSISTPVVGWISANNPDGANLGADRESDISLRARRAESVAITGAGTVDAITADIEKLTQDKEDINGGYVISCKTYEATTEPTAEVELAHSFKSVIYDQGSGAWDNVLAQTIWNTKPAGIQSLGSSSGIAVDVNGDNHTVNYERVVGVPIHIIYTLKWSGATPNAATMAAQIESGLRARYIPGQTISALFVESYPLNFSNITDVTNFRIGIVDPPTTALNVPINYNQIGTFAAANIDITFDPPV